MDTTCARCGAVLPPGDASCPACGAVRDAAEEDARQRLTSAAGELYEIVRAIGQGGMGHVFLARDRRLGRLAALKVLPPFDALRAGRVERFRREAEIAAKLSHPNIVPVYGAGGDAATPWFAMAYVEGETLAARLEREGPLPLADALRVLREIGDALAYAHRRGVVHRDVKPSNILLERETHRALIADFGISRAFDAEGMTQSGVALGTPGYMAPEQASGAAVDPRADEYALGLVSYEMFTGRRFDADFGSWPSQPTEVRRALRGTGRVSPPLAAAVARATALKREERFPDVDGFVAALEQAAAPSGSRRWQLLAAVAAALALGALGVAVRLGRQRSGAAVEAPGSGIALLRFAGDSAAADSLLPLLRYQLAGFAALTVADPRVFDPPRGADAGSPVVRDAARRAGAGWILHGLGAGPPGAREVDVRAVEVGTARVMNLGLVRTAGIGLGTADSVLSLVARSEAAAALGLGGTPGGWGRGGDAPGSIQAARAFFHAEEAFRRADYEGAARGYARVAELDTTFVLARYKRFLAELQTEPDEERVRRAVAEIHDILPRVGPRERELLTAYVQLFDSADVAGAEARLRRLVMRDSTFLDGWFGLAEVRFHFGALAGLPPDSAESAFRRALALWPGAAPAEMHLVAIDLWFGRRDQAHERISRYLAVDSTSTIAQMLRLGRSVLFGSPAAQRDVLGRLSSLEERVVELGAITGVAVARDRADVALARQAFQELVGPSHSRRVRREAANFVVATLLAEGRWGDAQAELATLRGQLPEDPDLARWPAAAAALGFGGRPPVPPRGEPRLDPARAPFSAFASGWLERYGRGMRALSAGDTAQALADFAAQDLLTSVADGVVRGPVWLAHGRILAARAHHAEAERYLRRAANLLAYAEPPFDAVRDSARAELERLGVRP